MSLICQGKLPDDMAELRALPGVQPLEMRNWLRMDDAYGAQMALRVQLLRDIPEKVMAQTTGSEQAISEALELVLRYVVQIQGFERRGALMMCPDGRAVSLNDAPLRVLGQLIQEDICLMQKPDGEGEHRLSAAVLCFPAHWTLSEKIGRTLGRIHVPVDVFTEDIARRVQRLFDGVKEGRALWRFNRAYAGPQLYQPRDEAEYKHESAENAQEYLRAERQSLVRLPKSGAVLFSIHTYVVAQTGKQF